MEQPVVDFIYDQLLERILNKHWEDGTMLPTETELAKEFQASRSSVRQAIARLKALGMLESRRGSGTVVKRPNSSSTLTGIISTVMFDVQDHLHIFEFHKGIQIECAKLACMRYTEEQMRALLDHMEQMKKLSAQGDMEGAIFHDLESHRVLCEMSGNIMFVRATELIYQHLHNSFRLIASSFDYQESIVFHERLIAALLDRNPMFAASVMEAHQWDTYQKFLRLRPSLRKMATDIPSEKPSDRQSAQP